MITKLVVLLPNITFNVNLRRFNEGNDAKVKSLASRVLKVHLLVGFRV